VNGGCNQGRERRFDELTPLFCHLERTSEQRLRGCRAQADNRTRMHDFELGIKPWTAGADFTRIGLCVNSSLSARFPFEMLDDVRDVGAAAIDAGLLERFRQDAPRGPYKRMACEVFVIAWLLADEHHVGFRPAFSEYGLRSLAPEITRAASLRGALQRFNRTRRWDGRGRHAYSG